MGIGSGLGRLDRVWTRRPAGGSLIELTCLGILLAHLSPTPPHTQILQVLRLSLDAVGELKVESFRAGLELDLTHDPLDVR